MSHHYYLLTCKKLVTFLADYNRILEKQLTQSREKMNKTVEDIMEVITELSNETEQKKHQATETLDQTFLNPDKETEEFIDSIQETVDDVFNDAQNSVNRQETDIQKKQANHHSDLRLGRFGGKFTKHMEALATMDDKTKSLLFAMMGALSNDDRVGQRIEHISLSLNALQVGLGYILVDLKQRFQPDQVRHFRTDLLEYTFQQYTMEEEKKLFAQEFPKEAELLTSNK